jgi:hypothetical protein
MYNRVYTLHDVKRKLKNLESDNLSSNEQQACENHFTDLSKVIKNANQRQIDLQKLQSINQVQNNTNAAPVDPEPLQVINIVPDTNHTDDDNVIRVVHIFDNLEERNKRAQNYIQNTLVAREAKAKKAVDDLEDIFEFVSRTGGLALQTIVLGDPEDCRPELSALTLEQHKKIAKQAVLKSMECTGHFRRNLEQLEQDSGAGFIKTCVSGVTRVFNVGERGAFYLAVGAAGTGAILAGLVFRRTLSNTPSVHVISPVTVLPNLPASAVAERFTQPVSSVITDNSTNTTITLNQTDFVVLLMAGCKKLYDAMKHFRI